MDFAKKLSTSAHLNSSLVCVGLDSEVSKLPAGVNQLDFNKAIIDATADLVCAYKPNSAFYEADGAKGIQALEATCAYILENYPKIPIILDAKRADIGNTNNGYTDFAFKYLKVDAITLQPYLGREAIQPFLDYKDKGLIILCRTSNPGAGEFQDLESGGKKVYELVAEKVRADWNDNHNCLLVVGATYPEELAQIRQIVGQEMTFLVPGVGAQGGDVEKTLQAGLTRKGDGLIINSSRGIIFASNGADFAEAARAETVKLRKEINKYR